MALTPRALLRAAALCAVAFAGLMAAAYGWSDARRVDASALQGFLGLERPATEQVFDAFARLGDPLQVGLIGVALAALAVARGRPRVGLFVIALLAATSVSSQALKALLAYPRYDGTIDGLYVSAAAFPSGHSTAAMAMAIALVVVMPSRLRPVAAVVAVALALSISFSVVALGGHFPSDVVGGYLLATGWALVLLAGLRWAGERYPERTWRTGLATMARQSVEGAGSGGPGRRPCGRAGRGRRAGGADGRPAARPGGLRAGQHRVPGGGGGDRSHGCGPARRLGRRARPPRLTWPGRLRACILLASITAGGQGSPV